MLVLDVIPRHHVPGRRLVGVQTPVEFLLLIPRQRDDFFLGGNAVPYLLGQQNSLGDTTPRDIRR
jgi:hypothetical protein